MGEAVSQTDCITVSSDSETVPLAALLPGDSPRLSGEDRERILLLADSPEPFTPIVVHRQTMRVIDGMHRLRATALRGESAIAVRYFEGTEHDAFVLAVRLNATHGLPLSRGDRAAAATRILTTHPQWSDRAIAAATGLATKTVARIRRRSTGEVPQSNARIGRDGRVRPVDPTEGRRRAVSVIAAHPDASLRQISREAGISLGTARDVRKRLDSNQDPVPQRRRAHHAGAAPRPTGPESPLVTRRSTAVLDREVGTAAGARERARAGRATRPFGPGRPTGIPASTLEKLRRDPSLRHSEVGRVLLRLLDTNCAGATELDRAAASVPTHCAEAIAEAARACADVWSDFATQIEARSDAPE
ncbi:ParB/RepB/Spo0J family partition protein [Streptomyces sp. PTM05]|uniref:ParB/RepB/Spo0J family partition protein n=1 Tax=Streptantibioticus parmotrematis TaxID=2873249 RepID=A0ABS7QQM6_9ACTN|nr:ParB/RepB/Spo0J family partition protein [Streptantibioticus parmotrematis]MBY8885475.1 ParB/RepB/Spo0J family partition protein [Streptantibioticus parmotrematis]